MQKMQSIRTSFSIQLSRNLSHSTTMLSFAVSKRLLPACPINLLRSTFRLCSTFPSANPPDLIEWVRSQGGEVHRNLKIASCRTEGLRIMATGQIPKGAELISLPSCLHLKWNRGPSQGGANAILDRLAYRFLSNGSYNCWVMKAGLRLLQERAMGTRSYWWPYISNLPETSTTSIFLYSECMENLQFTSLTQEVNRLKRFLHDFGNQVNTVLKDVSPKDHPFGGKDINSASLRWAYLTAASRAFLCCTLENKGPVFLPLVDMCSHCSKPNATYVEVAHNMSVNLVAEEQIEKDAQVTLDYGSLSNDRFLLDYVFFPRNRYSAQFELTFDMKSLEFVNALGGDVNPNFPSPASWQKEILSQLNLIGNKANLQVSLGGPNLIDGRLLAALRVIHSSNKEAVKNQNWISLMKLGDVSKPPLGSFIEQNSLATIIALCRFVLQYHFPTTIMEDESILKKMNVSHATWLAARFRMHKKVVLLDVMENLIQRVKDLNTLPWKRSEA